MCTATSAKKAKVYMQFLAHRARKLSWNEVAESVQTSWEEVFDF